MLAGGTSLVVLHEHALGRQRAAVRAWSCRRRATPFFVCPAFEEDRAREQIALGPVRRGTADVRTWQEDESPFERVAQGLKDRGIATGRSASRRRSSSCSPTAWPTAPPQLKVASGTPITAGCRMIKDAHEIELMRLACAGHAEGVRSGL